MKDNKSYLNTTEDISSVNTYIVFLKSLILCLVLSLVMIVVYAMVLSSTSMSDTSMAKITQTIIILSIALSAMFGGRKIKQKGWLFGMMLGFIYVIALIPLSLAFGQQFSLDKYLIVKMLMGCAVGLIGGVIGVNL